MTYDDGNVFAKILRGEIPCSKVYEDDHALAFHDISAQAPVHVLVIPKGPYVSLDDFTEKAPEELVVGFFRAVGETARRLGVTKTGYRMLTNIGRDANQEVMHFHAHIFAGRPLGGMIKRG